MKIKIIEIKSEKINVKQYENINNHQSKTKMRWNKNEIKMDQMIIKIK